MGYLEQYDFHEYSILMNYERIFILTFISQIHIRFEVTEQNHYWYSSQNSVKPRISFYKIIIRLL